MPSLPVPLPGPPSSVLLEILAADPNNPPQAGDTSRATFSATGLPLLPSMMTEVVQMAQYAVFNCNVIEVTGELVANGWATPVTSIASSYTTQPTDSVILANASAGAVTVTLADGTTLGTGSGARCTVVNAGTAGTVTVNASNGQLINGGSQVSLSAQYSSTSLAFDGVATDNWFVLASTKTSASSVNYKPSNPTGTTGTVAVMMGCGTQGTLFTPLSSGKVGITVTGEMGQQTNVVFNTVGGRYGSGSAPSNGAAGTGTRFGGSQDAILRPSTNSTTNTGVGFAFTDVISLTPGTTYWFDLALATGAGADQVFVQNLSFSIEEKGT
jgi:hypothetical protein